MLDYLNCRHQILEYLFHSLNLISYKQIKDDFAWVSSNLKIYKLHIQNL